MYFDYIYGEQSEQYNFMKIPMILIKDERFNTISSDAKILYALLLDRVSLSVRNQWVDDKGRTYIYYTLEHIQDTIHCADKKATRLMNELENCGLIERVKQGQGKPARIYVKNFIPSSKGRALNRQDNDSRVVGNTILDSSQQRCNQTDINHTDFIQTESIPSIPSNGSDERTDYQAYFQKTLQVDYLKMNHPHDADIIDEMVELLIDAVMTKAPTMLIAGDRRSTNVVKSRFMKLDYEHIEFVLRGLKENTTKVVNMKQYLLASLYNAPLTISSYYQSLVNHDMATGQI
ncbi:DUF6017 domain-containing protein [Butyrivibrio sp. INlla14]|uniref:DUF6017 domain-containing protein n=1 Tax=Butyrivibrio sp. INlla14 TaxID=1520808 RepID=UPI0008768C26|nr:DUF6017 domain-containing protein [Butyrivibrio sp. INlla14]SCY63269.1 Replication initiator protein A (RepA) N-terminus [Butyrivibrio sp. INlla14]